jgi:hypothetical protein
MKIELKESPNGQRDTTFKALKVTFDLGGTRYVCTSEVITPQTPPGQLAAILEGLAREISSPKPK